MVVDLILIVPLPAAIGSLEGNQFWSYQYPSLYLYLKLCFENELFFLAALISGKLIIHQREEEHLNSYFCSLGFVKILFSFF